MTGWGVRRVGASLGAGLLLVLSGPLATAVAEPPLPLGNPIIDTAGVLSPRDGTDVAIAQDRLLEATDLQLWVAYVTSFDGLSGEQWAAQTAQVSGFGGNDMLFAVAVGDRAYGYDVAADMPVSDSELEEIIAGDVEPELRDGDWAGAAVALAEGIAAAASGSSSGGGGSVVPWLVGGALLVGGVVLVVWLVRRGRAGLVRPGVAGGVGTPGSAGAASEPTIEALRQQAAAALIDVDDSIKTSEQELGFAVAQFGQESTGEFTQALEQSRTDLTEAFGLQRRAQAAAGGPDERALLTRILDLCATADKRLDDQVEAFDRLRDLERTIDTVLPSLEQQVAPLPARAEAAAATIDELSGRWPAAALAPLGRQLEQARERITFAQESVRVGTQLLAAADRGGAVARARATEEAVGQAGTLLAVVERAPETLEMTRRAVDALLAETRKDLAEAERLGVPPTVAGPHHFALDTLRWAEQTIASGNYDPAAIRRALEDSDAALDRALEPLRAEAQRRERASTLLPSATDAARASIRAANDFILTRRGAVGAEARTRLAEAQRRLDSGMAESDPIAALEHVQAADALADQSYVLAQQDEARTRDAQRRDGGSGSLGTAILGGILIDAMTRGGGFGGVGGGVPGGGRGGGGRGGGFGGRPGPGSFGGSSTRARRSGGGRF